VKWRSAAPQWRNWPLQQKLALVLVVPVLGSIVLGILRVQGEVDRADSYADTEPIVELRASLLKTVTALQAERKEAVAHGPELAELARETDAQLVRTRATVRAISPLDGAARQRFGSVVGALEVLPRTRQQVADGAEGHIALYTYNAMIGSVLEFDRSLVGRFPDVRLTNISIALNKIQAAREQAAIEQATGLVALRNDVLAESDRQEMIAAEARLGDNLTDLHAVAPDNLRAFYASAMSGSEVAERAAMARDAPGPGTTKLPFSAAAWNEPFDATAARMHDVSRRAAVQLSAEATTLANDYASRAALAAALLIAIVLLAAGIAGGLAHFLIRSVESMRRTALDVAYARLPDAVSRIRAGEGADVRVDPVPVHTTEEFGQLARAFDAVHGQAVRSAAEEAGMRTNLATILTNLSHRSQGLVQRQLRLMEQLEQREDDPDKLANLSRIDYLATKMRRNNENMMVLSGSSLRRRFTEPVPLATLLRAAVSEVEHYQRVLLRSAPDTRVLGHVVGNLMRSVCELVENATKFSGPDSAVVVTCQQNSDDSAQIDIFDEGVGMAEIELYEANRRLAAGDGTDVPVSRQMGLYVVGRLTARHGIHVVLRRRGDHNSGLCATIYLPPTMVSVHADPVGPTPTAQVAPDPGEGLPTVELVKWLASAGVEVRLPDIPAATTPASLLFITGEQAESADEPFNWLEPAENESGEPSMPGTSSTSSTSVPTMQPVPALPYTLGPNGLPKRVPRRALIAPSMKKQPPARKTDANQNRVFLSGFQAGVRASEEGRRPSES
jgi:signal transduction histidine kinase